MARAPEAPYVRRALAESIARATSPIVILEGPRGAGKTSLVLNETVLSHFHYVTLADEEVFERAVQQPVEWVASLSRPAIIDEAQRLDSLIAAVQQIAPKKPVEEPVFILVSSRVLPIEEPKAPEPPAQKLAEKPKGRKKPRKPLKPQRFTLFPLTQAEMSGRPGCIVDDLFDRELSLNFRSSHPCSDLRTMMRLGGFPHHALHLADSGPQQRSERVRQGMAKMMAGDDGSKGLIDQMIESSILKKVLASPGIPLGLDAMARACYVDEETLTTHLDSFVEHLLVHCLPDLSKKRKRDRGFGKTRVHPIDTVLAVEALAAMDRDIAVDPYAFGRVLWALCVNQLVAAAQWASEETACCHWKRFDRRVRRVDLVLSRKDRLVGITVRNSVWVRSDTIGALRFLAEDERFVRGFIVYLGSITLRLTEKIWAIPVSALWEKGVFLPWADEEVPDEEELEEEGFDDVVEEEETEGLVEL